MLLTLQTIIPRPIRDIVLAPLEIKKEDQQISKVEQILSYFPKISEVVTNKNLENTKDYTNQLIIDRAIQALFRVLIAIPMANLIINSGPSLLLAIGACCVLSLPTTALLGAFAIALHASAVLINAVMLGSFGAAFQGLVFLLIAHRIAEHYDIVQMGILEKLYQATIHRLVVKV